jgi:predicted transcriptional regulator
MPKKNLFDTNLYNQVKGVIRSLNLDQNVLAEKLGVNQANISKALNGANEKTFQRIIDFLESEHGITSFSQHLESSLSNDIVSIKEELIDIKASLEKGLAEIKEMLKKQNE